MTHPLLAPEWDSASAYEDSVMAALRPHLGQLVERLRESGAPLPDPEDLAEAMAAGAPDATEPSEYARLLGPFYSSGGAMRVLRIRTRQALDDRRKRGTLLAARTSDDIWVYPSFQFDTGNHTVKAGLVAVLAALKSAPRWGAALWLVTVHPDLADRSPLSALDDADAHDLVVQLAAQYTAAIAA